MNRLLPLSSQPHETEGDTPLVSVVIPTFNGERWVGMALDGVLMQQTSFAVEILVSDDCSSDGTVAIAKGYEERYPGIVRVIARPKNVGMQRNYYDTFEQSRGRYIAWLDCDDYWTDPQKLELQVEAMEADPSLMMCCHYVRWIARGTDKVERERYPEVPPGRHGMQSILRSNFIPSPSIMFRSGLQRELPEWYFDVAPLGDWPVNILAAMKGDILLLDRVMADYTLNQGSMFWSEGTLFWRKQDAEFYDRIVSWVPRQFRRQVRSEKGKRYEAIAYMLRKQGDFAGSRQAALKAFRSPELSDNLLSKTKSLGAAMVREAQWRLGLLRSSGEST
jgi:glycosyltransferase involved in cell wall biosynthesis